MLDTSLAMNGVSSVSQLAPSSSLPSSKERKQNAACFSQVESCSSALQRAPEDIATARKHSVKTQINTEEAKEGCQIY
jgi:hypothetical protein